MLSEVLIESQSEIRDDLDRAAAGRPSTRRVDALRIVEYKLERLREHLDDSRRLLNDLRMLRRLLHGQRDTAGVREALS